MSMPLWSPSGSAWKGCRRDVELFQGVAKGSVGLVSIADRLDLSTPQGRAMAGVSAVFSELSERCNRAKGLRTLAASFVHEGKRTER